eukprot:420123-Pyramimonas_sp.AAC.1
MVQVAVWRVHAANPWKATGDKDERRSANFKMLRLHLQNFYETHNVDLSYRLRDVTPKIFGDGPNGPVHTKAAETGPLVRWARQLLVDFACVGGDYLLPAADALLRHLAIIRDGGPTLPHKDMQELMDTFHRHITCFERGGGKFIPKHHLWCHLVMLVPMNGNPRCYSTFLDESLNGL